MSIITDKMNEQNSLTRVWTTQTKSQLRNNIRSLSNKGKGDLLRSLKHNYSMSYGVISKISIKFIRHGVFFQKGVGRGYRSTNGIVHKVRPGEMRRRPEDWFNQTLDQRVPILADQVCKVQADAAVNSMNAKIK